MLAHYAAHHGNVKFLRWLINWIRKATLFNFDKHLDFYDCNIAHYAVRQGHLPIVMMINDEIGVSMKQRDRFGYSCLEYSLMYKKLHCFLFVYYKYGHKIINESVLQNIADRIVKDGTATDMAFLNIILNEKILAEQLAPVLLLTAIKYQKINMIQIIYEACIYHPERSGKSGHNIIGKPQIQQLLGSLDQLQHLSVQEKKQISNILNGFASKNKYHPPKGR